MDELRSWFEVPAIAHYFHVFRNAFDLLDFDIEDFEETLLVDGSDNVSSFIPDLVIRLLRGLYKTKDGLQVTLDNYGHYLHDLLNFHYGVLQKKENPLINSSFKELPIRTKVEILYDMINWRLDLEDAMELTKNLEADEMRVEPVGKDNDGNVYWYFYGARLYKEGYSVKNEESLEESEAEIKSTPKLKKRKKKAVAQTRSGRAVRKKRKIDTSSEESGDESEKSVEIPDDDSTTSNSLKNDAKSLKINITHNVWSLVCTTADTWQGLIDSVKGSTTKNEKQLLKNLEELFETIPAIIKVRDEKVQKKLLALAPRRVSDRITYRMQLKEEEERMQEQERLLKKQQKAKDEEEKQKKLEMEKAEEREKRYKEREKIQEQRALRAKLREEQKIVRVNPELAKVLNPTSTNSSQVVKKEKAGSAEPEEEEDNDFSSMSIVLEGLKEHDDAWLFLQPVKEEEAPNYYTYIKNPMDFQTIGDKIKGKAYKDKYEFENDVLLVFDNCETYNGTYSPFTKLAFKVKRQFHKLMKREFPRDIHEDDDDFFQSDDHPTKAKKSKMSKNTPLPSKNHSFLQTKKERKPRKEKLTSSLSDLPTTKTTQLKTKPVYNIHQKPQVSQLSPISATNFLSTRFGIPPNVLKQMSPAQMQSLILRYPRAGFVPALQGLMGHKLNVNSNTSTLTGVANVVGTTTLSPLHQLANTALAPSSAPSPASLKSVSIALPILPKSTTPAPILNKSPQGIRTFNPGQVQSTLGRPRKNTLASASIVSTSTGGYVSGLSVSGVPVTIQWDELKKQLMAQMVPSTSSTTTIAPSGKYVSGVTVSGAPITIEWEELKKQLVSQMKKEDSAAAPLNKENVAMSLLHLNSSVNTIVSMTPPCTIAGIPNLRPNIVTMASAGSIAGIPNLRPNLVALGSTATLSGISNLRPNVVSMASTGTVSMIPNLRPNSVTMASASAISGIPSLRPVNIPAAVPLRFTKELGAATTTTPANSKMFSFSNVLKNKEPSMSPAKPVTIKTPTFDCTTTTVSVENVAKTTSSLPLSSVKLQSGHAKVQDWLQSSSPFIVQNADNTRPYTKVTSSFQDVISGETKVASSSGSILNGKSPSLRFIGGQVLPAAQQSTPLGSTGKDVTMEYIPRPSFLTTSSKLVPIALPNVHHMVTTIANNSMNIIPIKGPVVSQGRTIAAVSSKSNLLDLQKAALQAAAVNQISSKLQNHLKKDQQKESKSDAFNYVIKDSIVSTVKPKKSNETITSFKANEPLATSSSVVFSQLSITTASPVVLNQLNNLSSNQLINSANILTTSGNSSVPVAQSRILIMQNRSASENPANVPFPSSSLVNIQPGRPASGVSQVITSRFSPLIVTSATPKIPLINHTTPSTCNSLPFVKAPIPIQIPQSLGGQIITTLPTTKYVTFAPKPVAVQPSQLSKLIVPSVPPLSKISQPQSVRFQTISSDIPVLQPKSNTTNKQFVVQQRLRDQGQGQTVRYILPAQTQLPSGQIINLNQLGSVQNLFINNVPIAKNQTTKSVRIVSGNLSNGIAKSTNNKILVTPTLGVNRLPNASVISNLGSSTQVKGNEAIVMRSPVKVGISADSQRCQVTSTLSASPVFTIASNIIPKKTDSIQNLAISTSVSLTSKTESSAVVNNLITLPRQSIPLQPNVVRKIELNSQISSVSRHPILLQSTNTQKHESISMTNSNNNNNPSIAPRMPVSLHSSTLSDTRKLLPKTSMSSLPNGISSPSIPASSQASTVKSPDGKTGEKQKHIVLDPTQLQKLKEEGRIVMTATGQLIMIPPNLVGKVPGSVFK